MDETGQSTAQSSFGLAIQDSGSLVRAYAAQKEQKRIPKFLVKVEKKRSSLEESESVILSHEMAQSEAVAIEKVEALKNSESLLKEALQLESEQEHRRSLANALQRDDSSSSDDEEELERERNALLKMLQAEARSLA